MQLLFSHPQFQQDRQLHQTCTLSDRCDRPTQKANIAPPKPWLKRALGDRPMYSRRKFYQD